MVRANGEFVPIATIHLTAALCGTYRSMQPRKRRDSGDRGLRTLGLGAAPEREKGPRRWACRSWRAHEVSPLIA